MVKRKTFLKVRSNEAIVPKWDYLDGNVNQKGNPNVGFNH